VPYPYRIYITTCDKYVHALLPMAHLMGKYWPHAPNVEVIGFTPPPFVLPPSWNFHSMGKQEDYPFNKWTNAVMDFVSSRPEEVFALMLEDMWPIREVDERAVQILVDYMHQFEYVARIDLTGDRLYAMGMRDYAPVSRIDLIQSMPGSPYHCSLMAGLWRKRALLDVLQRDWSPHDVELQGTPKLSFMTNWLVLGTRQWPLRHTLAFRAQDSNKLLLDQLDKADIDAMRALGYFKPWEG